MLNVSRAGIAEACRDGDLAAVVAILNACPTLIESINPHPWHRTYGGQLERKAKVERPIEVAAHYGHGAIVAELLDRWTDTGRALDAGCFTAVGVAQRAGHAGVLDVVLERVATFLTVESAAAADERGRRLLYMAAEHLSLPLVKLLLERGVPPGDEEARAGGWQPVDQAVWYGWPLGGHRWDENNRLVVEYLIDNGAAHDLWTLAGLGDLERIVHWCARHPGALHSFARGQEWMIRAPLGIAAWNGHDEAVRWLLEQGADPNGSPSPSAPNDEFGSAVIFAEAGGHHDIVMALLDAGADLTGEVVAAANVVEACYQSGNPTLVTYVMGAGGRPSVFSHVRARNHGVVAELLARNPEAPDTNWQGTDTVFGAIVSAATWVGNSVALAMALRAHPDMLSPEQALAEIRRAIVSHNRDGSFNDYRQLIVMLLDHIGDEGPSLGSIVEYTVREYYQPVFGEPLQLEQAGELISLFLERGADPNAAGEKGTPLEAAVTRGYASLVEQLLAVGARVTKAALSLAQDSGFVALADELGTREPNSR